MKNKEFTKRQHYVPEMHIKRFHNAKVSSVYMIDCEKHEYQKPVSIKEVSPKSICFNYYNYEIFDKHGNIIAQNFIENFFKQIENEYSTFLDELIKKLDLNIGSKTACILSTDEKQLLHFWIMLLNLRSPKIIEVIQEQYNISKDATLANLFVPKTIDAKGIEGDFLYNPILNKVFSEWKLYNYYFYHAGKNEQFISSDFPVVPIVEQSIMEAIGYYYPLSPQWGVVLLDKKHCKQNDIKLIKQKIVEAPFEEIKRVNETMVLFATKYLYSSNFTPTMIEIIEEIKNIKINL